MSDVIQLLPDSIASQIAAGEVIQRPASVVKELMENSIDANATEVMLVIKDAGKVLIQVSDNGKGMSETDARMCFERHATSKIQSANDIFKIKTKGFRGEALASIAAIGHVEMITRQLKSEVGTKIIINGSKFKKQEIVQSNIGTKISVKNLFFNVPARRKFLKSDSVELKHITDEFVRLALAHIDISFSFYHNGRMLYQLAASNLIQRISAIFGRGYESKLLPVVEEMEIVKINGFIGKISASRRTRTNQFLFVNNRFIKSNYLNHAINISYSEYLKDGQYPIFFLYLDIDPDKIDVNIHPTKQEIKFEDERLIYNFVRVAVKHVLGKFTYTPSLDFEPDAGFQSLSQNPNQRSQEKSGNKSSYSPPPFKPNENRDEWEKAFEILQDDNKKVKNEGFESQSLPSSINKNQYEDLEGSINFKENVYQLHNSYILKQVKSGFLLIDQQNAHERVLFEEYINGYDLDESVNLQQLLFPQVLNIDKSKVEILKTLFEDLLKFGFMLEEGDNGEVLIKGVPAMIGDKKGVSQLIENIVDDYVKNIEIQVSFKENFARILSKENAKHRGEVLSIEEMEFLVDSLFQCENPYTSPRGKKCFIKVEMEEIIKRFNK